MLTPRQEAFARGLAEGLTQSEAYRRAYPNSLRWSNQAVWNKASLMAAHGGVRVRVAELQAKAAAANELSLAEHLRSLAELRDEARADGQFGPAVTAEVSRGKCSGLYVERVRHEGQDGAALSLAVVIVKPKDADA